MIYIIFYISILVCLLCTARKTSVQQYAFIPVLIMTLVVGLRYKTGSDLENYEIVYNRVLQGQRCEYGLIYWIVVKMTQILHMNFQGLVLIYAILSFAFLYLTIIEICKDKQEVALCIMSFYAFMFANYFIIMRQFLAACILTYVFSKNDKRKIINLLLLVIACLTHAGATICIPIMYLVKSKLLFKDWKKVVAMMSSIFIGVSELPIIVIKTILKLFPQYAYYADKSNFGVHSRISILIVFTLLLYLITIFLERVTGHEWEKKDIISVGVVATIIIYFSTLALGWFNRSYWYIYIYTMFLSCWIISYLKKGKNRTMAFLICSSLISIYIIYFYLKLQITQINMFPYLYNFKIWG